MVAPAMVGRASVSLAVLALVCKIHHAVGTDVQGDGQCDSCDRDAQSDSTTLLALKQAQGARAGAIELAQGQAEAQADRRRRTMKDRRRRRRTDRRRRSHMCGHMCAAPCSTGSCTNFIVVTANYTACNDLSQSAGCGDCKTSLNSDLSSFVATVQSTVSKTCSRSDLEDKDIEAKKQQQWCPLTVYATLCPSNPPPHCVSAQHMSDKCNQTWGL